MRAKLPKARKEPEWGSIEVEGLRVGVICDLHIPYHSKVAIETACSYLKDCGIDQLVILGDFVDFYSISRHDKSKPLNNDLSVEIKAGREGLEWIRGMFPGIPIKWKEGNHDDRVKRYVRSKAPELSGLDVLTTENLFGLKDLGIEFVRPTHHLRISDLNLIHGHELSGSGGKTPAYRLYQKAMTSAMCGHFHRSDEYWQRDLSGNLNRCYTLGALCSMTPEYMRVHNWNHGFALIERAKSTYRVENKRIIDNIIL